MNADELADEVTSAREVLRVETLEAYDAESDVDYVDRYLGGAPKPDPSEKAAWLGLIRAADASGRPWRRLRIVQRPVADYVRYACEWGYVDNVDAGERVRVLDEADQPNAATGFVGDYYVLDGRVLAMRYDAAGAFVEAWEVSTPDRLVELAERTYAAATPFPEWWAANPDLHRDGAPVTTG